MTSSASNLAVDVNWFCWTEFIEIWHFKLKGVIWEIVNWLISNYHATTTILFRGCIFDYNEGYFLSDLAHFFWNFPTENFEMYSWVIVSWQPNRKIYCYHYINQVYLFYNNSWQSESKVFLTWSTRMYSFLNVVHSKYPTRPSLSVSC